MKGVILAGGKGERLFPLTKATNKHLLPVGTEPMIFHQVKQLLSCGIKDILVVTSTEHMGDIVSCLGSGKYFKCEFTFKVQEEAGGIAQALGLAKNFVGDDRIVVFLGDNIFEKSIRKYVDNFRKQKDGARVLLKKVDDPSRFGIAALDEKERMIVGIEEKPTEPKTNYAVAGVYMYCNDVFDIIKNLKKSERGEYEISDVNGYYVKKGKMCYDIIDGRWMDAGTFASYKCANDILFEIENKLR